MRIAIGGAFGALLIGGGEWLRRRAARIAEGLTAAGVADLLACLYVAVDWYGLIGPIAGFVAMAAVTGLGVFLALRHGWMVALIGLLGGLLTPAVVEPTRLEAGGVFGYLLLLQVGIVVIGRWRRWPALEALALAGGIGWALAWLIGIWVADWPARGTAWIAGFVVLSAAVFVTGALTRELDARPRSVGFAAPMACLGLMPLVVHAGGFSAVECALFGVLGAGCLGLARLRPAYEPVGWAACGATAVLVVSWHARADAAGALPWAVLGYGALYALGAYGCLWGAARRDRWAALSVAAGLGFLLIGRWAQALPASAPWWPVAAGLVAALGARWLPRPLASTAPAALVGLGAAASSVGPVLLLNPLWTHRAVGAWPVANWLLYAYGAPAALLLASAFAGALPLRQRGSCGVIGIGLLFVLVSLAVRQGFQGAYLDGPAPSHAEWSAYSAAWIAFAAGLLLAGLLARGAAATGLRWASLAVMFLSVGKVFLFDLAHLEDLLRVASFLGLGASLMVLAWVYQRFVFGPTVRPRE